MSDPTNQKFSCDLCQMNPMMSEAENGVHVSKVTGSRFPCAAPAVQPQTASSQTENDPISVCLRIDHMHRKELGCWEYRPISERRKEADSSSTIVGKIEGLSARLISESCQADYCYCEGCGVRRKVASELRAIVGQNKT